jgi:hypothetical protein
LDSIVAIQDLDADGRPEVVAMSIWGGVFVVNGSTGLVLWRTTTPLPIGTVLALDQDGDARFDLYVADRGCSNSGVGAARIYSFPAGFAAAPSTLVFDTSAHGYWCGLDQAFGDVDGDGTLELISLSSDRVITYDLATGLPKDRTEPLGHFPWGRGKTYAADIDGDGRDEIMVATDNVAGTYTDTRRLLLVEDDGAGLARRWAVGTDASGGAHRFPEPPFGRLAAGPVRQVVTSLYDPASGNWRSLVLAGDSADATPITEISGVVVLAIADVDGDGLDDLLSQDAPTASLAHFSTVRTWRLEAAGLRQLWSVDAATVPRASNPWTGWSTAVVLAAHDSSVPAAAILVDRTSDQRADRLDLVGPSGTIVASRNWTDDAPGLAVRALPSGRPQMFVTRGDGTIEQLDGGLRLLNDTAPPLGSADLIERSLAPGASGSSTSVSLAVVATASSRTLIAVDATEHTVAFDLDRVDPVLGPLVRWRAPDRIVRTALHATIPSGADEACRLSYAIDRDGSLAIVCHDVASGVEARRFRFPDSQRLHPYWGVTPLAGRLPFGSLAVPTFHVGTGFINYSRLDLDGSRLWPMDISHLAGSGGDGPGSAWDFNGDGWDDFSVTVYSDIRIVDGVSGITIADARSLYDGTATLDDVDGDTLLDVLHSGAVLGGPARLSSALVGVWTVEPGIWHNRAVAAPTTSGPNSIGTSRYASARFQVIRGTDGSLLSDQVLAGGRSWTDEASVEAAGVASGQLSDVTAGADITGRGRGSFLVGSTDGRVYALSADDGTLDWSVDLRAAVGEPIAADIDGDGVSEVLVAAGDGFVYAIERQELDAPAAVYDTDGTFIALSNLDELDELRSSTTAGANWPDVPGADGYEFALLTADDTYVVFWSDSASASRVVLSDLSLQLGVQYHFAVRARAADGTAGVRRSAETLSDGFIVIDDAPPLAAVAAVPPVFWPLEPLRDTSTTIQVVLSDQVGLQDWTLTARNASGATIASLGGGAIGGPSFNASVAWGGTSDEGTVVPTGLYGVIVTTDDVVGHTAEAATSVFVCGAESNPLCLGPDGDADADAETDGGSDAGDATADAEEISHEGSDGLPDGENGGGATWTGAGSGCSCRTTPRGHPLLVILLALALVAVLWFPTTRRARPR